MPVTAPLRVAMICTGNICRSPMAEVVVSHLVSGDDTLRSRVRVTSAGTARWHVGSAMDPRARGALNRAGFTGEGSPAAFADAHYLDAQHVIVAMTREHVVDVRARLTTPSSEILLLRDLFEATPGLDVPDPYYGGDEEFDRCLSLITRGGHRVAAHLRARLGATPT